MQENLNLNFISASYDEGAARSMPNPSKNHDEILNTEGPLLIPTSFDLVVPSQNSQNSPSNAGTPNKRRIRNWNDQNGSWKRRPTTFLKACRLNACYSEGDKFLFGLKHVIRIFLFLRNRIFYKSYKNLKQIHFSIIKDASIIFDDRKNTRRGSISRRSKFMKLSKLLSRIPLFDPNHILKILWDIIVFLVLFSKLIIFSLERSFEAVIFEGDLGRHLTDFLIEVLLIDVVCTLNTKIYLSGSAVKSRSSLTWNYFRRYFLIDLPTLIALTFNRSRACDESYSMLYLVLIPKIILCNADIGSRLKQLIINFNKKFETVWDIIALGCSILLAGHTIACIWHSVGYDTIEANPEEKSWLKEAGIFHEDWKVRYLYSIYWSITTMLTVGYGDITPRNQKEIIFNIFAMMYGCVVFGYSLNSIGEIIRRRNKITNKNKEKANFIKRMAKAMNLSNDLENKIMKYMEFYWQKEEKVDPEQESQVLSQLSSSLREEIYMETKFKCLSSIPIFKKSFSEKTLHELAHALKKIIIHPNELICKNQSDDHSLYILAEGQAAVVSDGKLEHISTIEVLKQNSYFGLQELFTGFRRRGGVVSQEFCILYQLNRQDFLTVLKGDFSDYEKYCKIRDDILIYQNQYALELRCASCQKFDHVALDCPFIKYAPNRFLIISKHQHRKKSAQKKYPRKTKCNKFHTLLNMGLVCKNMVEYQEDQNDEDEFRELKSLYEKELLEDEQPSLQSINVENMPEPSKTVRFQNSNSIETRAFENAISLQRLPSFSKVSSLNSKYKTDLNISVHKELGPKLRGSELSPNLRGNELSPKLKGISKQKKPSLESSQHKPILQSHRDLERRQQLFRYWEEMKNFKHYYQDGNADKVINRIRSRANRAALRKQINDGNI